ncbi:MAG: hypothetical protein LBR34_08500 [Prevotella sp.]|jgi:hypothetical protein|nr:hypothetical protein [Prevotella sp.]
MKTKLFCVSALMLLFSSCTTMLMTTDTDPNIIVYEKIPMAPNIVLSIETPLAAPSSAYIWIEGYWTWDMPHRDYVWVQGHWEIAPYAGAYWIPGYWEYYGRGYRWVDACWLPKDFRITYGYYSGRYDYYGRPVYYPRPNVQISTGYSYSYDHRPEYRGNGYSSASQFNNLPANERNSIKKDYQRSSATSGSSVRSASTSNAKQNTVRIRENNEQGRSATETQNGRTPATPTGQESGRTTSTTTQSGRQSTVNQNTNTTRTQNGSDTTSRTGNTQVSPQNTTRTTTSGSSTRNSSTQTTRSNSSTNSNR